MPRNFAVTCKYCIHHSEPQDAFLQGNQGLVIVNYWRICWTFKWYLLQKDEYYLSSMKTRAVYTDKESSLNSILGVMQVCVNHNNYHHRLEGCKRPKTCLWICNL